MTTIQREVRINARQASVWDVLADLGAIVNFHPFVINSFYTSDTPHGEGASRVCEFGDGLAIEETAVEWHEGESYTLRIGFLRGRTPPIHNNHAYFALRTEGRETVATLQLSYEPKFSVLGMALDKLMIQRQFGKTVAGILDGLKHHAETGETVDVKVLKRIQAAPIAA